MREEEKKGPLAEGSDQIFPILQGGSVTTGFGKTEVIIGLDISDF